MAAESTPPQRLAIVLHGRFGGMQSLRVGVKPQPTRSLDGATASVSSAAMCAASLQRHVIEPNRHRFAVDVFGHSWSPEISAALDVLFEPKRSAHEAAIPIKGFRCPDAGFALLYCYRTVSHLLGISRAMRLKQVEEASLRRPYTAVLLSRWDVLWQKPILDLHSLVGWHPHEPERRRRTVWLPRICAPLSFDARPIEERAGASFDERAGAAFRVAFCGGGASPWQASQAARECSRAARACQPDMTAEARELYVMDWWLLFGRSPDADEFAQGLSSRFAEHAAKVLTRLAARKRGAVAMGHAWFGAQLLWTMNTTLRHVGNIGVDFHLGRAWDDIDCLAMRPSCATATCRGSDLLAASPYDGSPLRRWQVGNVNAKWPHQRNASALPPAVSFPNPSSPMASSCEQRYFVCKRHSKMCYEADAMETHPMDRLAPKALFLGCAEALCAVPAEQPGLPWTPPAALPGKRAVTELVELQAAPMLRPRANSTACARLMLSLWLRVRAANRPGSRSRAADGVSGGSAKSAAGPHHLTWHRAAEAIRRHGSSAENVLRNRATRNLPEAMALALLGGPKTDAVCADAWQRSNGGVRMPVFRNVSR